MMELLVVMAIFSMMTVLATPSLMKSMRSSTLTEAGNQFTDIMMLARQNAVSRNAMTALVLVTNYADTNLSGRALTMLEIPLTSQTWNQVGGWVVLPDGTKAYDPIQDSVSVAASLPTLTFRGNAVSPAGYTCFVFKPDGTMLTGSTPLPRSRLACIQYSSDNAPKPGQDNTSTGVKNYYDVLLNADTGAIHVVRP